MVWSIFSSLKFVSAVNDHTVVIDAIAVFPECFYCKFIKERIQVNPSFDYKIQFIRLCAMKMKFFFILSKNRFQANDLISVKFVSKLLPNKVIYLLTGAYIQVSIVFHTNQSIDKKFLFFFFLQENDPISVRYVRKVLSRAVH